MSLLYPSTALQSSPFHYLPSPIPQLHPISIAKRNISITRYPNPTNPMKTEQIRSARIASIGSGGAQGGMKEQTWTHEGLITESLPNGMFKVRVDNGEVILGHVSGKIRQSRIKILPGDMVKIEVSRYDSTRGRITYRLKAKGKE